MDFENWESDFIDNLCKFVEEDGELELDFRTSAGLSAELDDLTFSDADIFFNLLDEPIQETERTPPHQPISAISPKLSSLRNNEMAFFNATNEEPTSAQAELQYLSSYPQPNSETLAIVNQNDMDCDDKDGIVIITENSLAEYFKGALSSPGKLYLFSISFGLINGMLLVF